MVTAAERPGPVPSTIDVGGGWRLWPDSALRVAGFPIEPLLDLGRSELWETQGGGRERFDVLSAEIRRSLASTVSHERFRLALQWQNPSAIPGAVDRWLRDESAGVTRSRRHRRRERMLAKYVQRYHAKNESIGFFGPVGWARWDRSSGASHAPVSVDGSVSEVNGSRVEIEHWVVVGLATRASRDPSFATVLKPIRVAGVGLDGDRVHLPSLGSWSLRGDQAAVLGACDGSRTPRQIASTLGLPRDGVEKILRRLTSMGLVSRELVVPTVKFPDRWLRSYLESADETAAAPALLMLDQLEKHRSAVATAAADESALAAARDELTAWLARTGCGDDRDGYQREVGREAVVEDCTTSLRASITDAARDELMAALGLVLTASRWLTVTIGHLLETRLTEHCDAAGTDSLPAATVLETLRRETLAPEEFVRIAGPAVAEMQRRWGEIVPAPRGAAAVTADPGEIDEVIAGIFATESADWLSGRYQSPDVMLVSTSAHEGGRARLDWVLGETHVAQNTLDQDTFVLAHPDHGNLLGYAEDDWRRFGRRPLLVGLSKMLDSQISGRNTPPPFMLRPRYDQVRITTAPLDTSHGGAVVEVGDLRVVRSEHGWVFRHVDGRTWEPLQILGEHLAVALGSCPLYPSQPHRPRVTIGRLTVAREQWTEPVDDVTWIEVTDEYEEYRAVTGWARDRGLPRFLFVHCIGENKPFYVDLGSPPLVAALAEAVRRQGSRHPGTSFVLTEMHPGPHQLWAPYDGEGARCTSEIRMAIFDDSAHRGSDVLP